MSEKITQPEQYENDVVTITDEKGKEHDFEVILHVPYEEKHYVVMHPTDEYPGLEEDTCVIFELIENPDGKTVNLIPEDDDDILDTVYALYVEWATEQEQEGDDDED